MLLVALLIVGLLVKQQIGGGSELDPDDATGVGDGNVPKVPADPNEVKQFEQDMNQFMEDEMSEKEDKINEATQ